MVWYDLRESKRSHAIVWDRMLWYEIPVLCYYVCCKNMLKLSVIKWIGNIYTKNNQEYWIDISQDIQANVIYVWCTVNYFCLWRFSCK